jgi:hypothetical protein
MGPRDRWGLTGVGHLWIIKVSFMLRYCDCSLGIWIDVISCIIDQVGRMVRSTIVSSNSFPILTLPFFVF